MRDSIFNVGDFIKEVGIELLEYVGAGTQAEVWKVRNPYKSEDGEYAARINYTATPDSKRDRDWLVWKGQLEKETEIWRLFDASLFVVKLRETYEVEAFEAKNRKFDIYIQTMEYVKHGSLEEYLVTDRRFNLFDMIGQDQKIPIFLRQIVSAVKTGHEVDRIHGDIKPSNIMLHVGAANVTAPQLMDFGLSQDSVYGLSGGFIGTPEYSPIEFLEGSVSVSPKTDIYSLGVVFYEILTGKRFVEGTDGLRPEARKGAVVGSLRTRKEFSLEEFDEKLIISQRRKHQLVSLVNSMLSCLSSNGDSTITLNSVQSALEDCESARGTEPKNSVRTRAYRWSKRVHDAMGETPIYYIVKSDQPYDDEQLIEENLAASGIKGYSLYRLVGTHDFMLRIWRSDQNEQLIDRAIQKYIDSHRHTCQVSQVKVREYNTHWDQSEYSSLSKEEALTLIGQCVHRDPSKELEKLKRRKLVTSPIANDRVTKVAIRVFLFVLCGRESLAKSVMDSFQDRCDKIVRSHAKNRQSGIKNISSYQCTVSDLKQADTQVGVMYRMILTDYHKYSELLSKIADSKRILEDYANKEILTTSLFELDKIGKVESDDGNIVYEAALFSRQ